MDQKNYGGPTMDLSIRQQVVVPVKAIWALSAPRQRSQRDKVKEVLVKAAEELQQN